MTNDHDEEREHCEAAIEACGGYYVDPLGLAADTVDAEDAVVCLMRERAAARAEGFAEGKSLPRSADRTAVHALQRKYDALVAAVRAYFDGPDDTGDPERILRAWVAAEPEPSGGEASVLGTVPHLSPAKRKDKL